MSTPVGAAGSKKTWQSDISKETANKTRLICSPFVSILSFLHPANILMCWIIGSHFAIKADKLRLPTPRRTKALLMQRQMWKLEKTPPCEASSAEGRAQWFHTGSSNMASPSVQITQSFLI